MLSKFFRQDFFIQCWVLPVWILLGLCKASILFTPFRSIASQLGTPLGNISWIPLLTPQQVLRAKKISTLVQGVANVTPWNSNCFPQAMAARFMLGFYGIPGTLFFGVCKNGVEMKAHAWVCAGSVRVTGGYSFNQFSVVGTYLFALDGFQNSCAHQRRPHIT